MSPPIVGLLGIASAAALGIFRRDERRTKLRIHYRNSRATTSRKMFIHEGEEIGSG